MKSKKYFHVLTLLIAISGCHVGNISSESNARIGQQIQMPSKIEIYTTQETTKSEKFIDRIIRPIPNKNMVLLYFRADCPSCMCLIEKWIRKAPLIENEGYIPLIILGACDHFELFKWIVENHRIDISYPLVLDLKDEFLKINSFTSGYDGPYILDENYTINRYLVGIEK